ncbi:DUF6397 family protein [Streptomyces sp. Je 1-79]|uniref:DUF6397 family protein n=1 Tax=Streptomyces sp. Je 1-79 TaxID=2943847 RepID=UPI0021A41304|nr:DUF6397 family protein [Streptomyces sp. Je 1-79]MCT4351905.1 DUF6397 family protein [Streptomyces sp. Je 1-79]
MTGEEGARVALAPTRAAQELELRRDEFQLAVQLGLVRTVPGTAPGTSRASGAAPGVPAAAPGVSSAVPGVPGVAPGVPGARGVRRRVEWAEIDRLRAAPDFPDGLRDRVRTVGTTEAAELLSVPPDRFTRLARTGHFSPVRFYLNRYRAVVWLYLAGELGEFALTRPALLTGRLPQEVRERLGEGEDRRPRNWRARRLGLLLRSTEDPWVRAAAIASLLDPVQLAEVVDDPYERTHLDRLRPEPPSGWPQSPAAREIADRLTVVDDPDEILWHRMSLALALEEARVDRPAPRPAAVSWAAGGPGVAGLPGAAVARPPRAATLVRPPVRRTRRGLLDRLRRRKATAGGEGETLARR